MLREDAVPDSGRVGASLIPFHRDGGGDAGGRSAVGDPGKVVPAVIAHEVDSRGYLPVFVVGSAIEVERRLFEGAAKGYNGQMQY